MYKILTDVASDITSELAYEYGIDALNMNLTLDGVDYLHTIDYQNLSFENFYDSISNGSICKTTQINPDLYYEYFKKYAMDKIDILYICLSAGLSNSYNSAIIAKQMIEEEFKTNVFLVDSISAGPSESLLALLAAINKSKGLNISQNYELMNNLRNNINLYFTLDDLSFLVNGGRLSKSHAFIGSALKLKPIIALDSEGKVVNTGTVRSNKGAIKKLISIMKDRIKEHPDNKIILINTRSTNYEFLKEQTREQFPEIEIMELKVGPFIGCHVGDTACGVCFIGKSR